jgi:hypothetical protein
VHGVLVVVLLVVMMMNIIMMMSVCINSLVDEPVLQPKRFLWTRRATP